MSQKIKHVTVLMSVYNDSEFLQTSVRSILNQTYKDFEFLIIDDGSTEDIEGIINNFKDQRIVYKKIRHTGLAGALNFGLENSTGDWVARIDADDINTTDRLETQVDFLNSNPSYDVVSSRSVYFEYTPENKAKVLFELKTPSEDIDIKKFLDLHNPINHSSVFFNRKVILDSGGYDEYYDSYEDFELWFRIRDKVKFKTLPDVLVYTRLRKDSMTASANKVKICSLLKENAEQHILKAADKREISFWKNILFWAEYFYGDKNLARKYFSNEFSFKQAIAFLNTFLPEKAFDKILGLRLRYRLESKKKDKKRFTEELKKLITI